MCSPQGSFDALKLQLQSVATVDTRALYPLATERATWDELRWFVPGFGYVKVEGSGLDETDYDGDGIVDRRQWEMQTMVAVPEPPQRGACWLAWRCSPWAAAVECLDALIDGPWAIDLSSAATILFSFVPPRKKHRAFPLSACFSKRIW